MADIRKYNEAHRHAGIGLLTRCGRPHRPGLGGPAARSAVLAVAYPAHPERYVRQIPQPPALPTAVWINKPEDNEVPPQ